MDLNHLSLDEIQIECEVRGIVGSSVEQFQQLVERLAAEKNKQVGVITKIHPRATKSLKFEFTTCVNKAKELKSRIESILTSNSPQILQLLSACRSRGLHIYHRLKRIISYSPRYAKRATTVQEVCTNLLVLIEKVICRTATADESLNVLKNIDTDNNESEIEDSDANSNKSFSDDNPISNKLSKRPSFQLPDFSVPPPNQGLKSGLIQDLPIDKFSLGRAQVSGKLAIDSNDDCLSSTQRIPSNNQAEAVDSRLDEISALINELKTDVIQGISTNASNRPVVSQRKDNNISPRDATYVSNRDNFNPHKYKPLPINQWGISFNGVSDKISIERFLNRAQFLAEQNNMPLERLSVDIVTILSGIAREYYWLIQEACHPTKTTWNHLKRALIHRFKSSLNDYDIKGVMKNRKQNCEKNESFSEFLSDILGMSLSLEHPLSEPDLINLLIENMRPGLHIELAGEVFRTVSDLEARCRAKERAWTKQGYKPEQSIKYQVPGGQFRRNISELPTESNYMSNMIPGLGNSTPSYLVFPPVYEQSFYPNYATNASFSDQIQPQYHIPGIPNSFVMPSQIPHMISENPQPECNISAFNPSGPVQNNSPMYGKRPVNIARMKCYNCENWGHSFLDCSVSNSGDFCTMCGRKGVLKPKCPSCWNRVGNYQPGVSVVGNHHFPETHPVKPNSPKVSPSPNVTGNQTQ